MGWLQAVGIEDALCNRREPLELYGAVVEWYPILQKCLLLGASRHSFRMRFCRSSLKITISCASAQGVQTKPVIEASDIT